MIQKYNVGEWDISGYKYTILLVSAGRDNWFEAQPLTPGVITRTAETKTVLRILLENDVINALKRKQIDKQRVG